MSFRIVVAPLAAVQARRVPAALPLLRALVLATLFLLPVQMRAGGADVHPHALLQLILDARDGSIDHHADDHAAADPGHGADHEGVPANSSQPDLPLLGDAYQLGGGMAMLAAIVAIFAIPGRVQRLSWPLPSDWRGWLPALEPPPPRFGCA